MTAAVLVAAAGASPLPFLGEAVALLAAAALSAYVCQRLGLVPIVGFLLAGVAIGPMALGLVRDRELVDGAAELGIILLLFTIGLEFSLERLAEIRRQIFLGGGLQVVLTVAGVAGGLAAFGIPWRAAVFTGCLAALSSTAIVLKLLQDRREMNTPEGQVSIGILLFQDLAVVAMVLLVPVLAGGGARLADLGLALGKAAGIVAAVLVVARRVMPPVLERVARTCSPEIFLLAVIATCLGTAWLSSLAGVSLSLGAFLAGLVVSESRFRHYAFSEILPLRILFSAVFFVSVGMLLDLGFVFREPLVVLATLLGLLAIKTLTGTASVRALGLPLPQALASGLLLAQVGEFSFVLERSGREMGLFPAGLEQGGGQAFIAATVVLMALTPLVAEGGARLRARLGRHAGQEPAAPPPPVGSHSAAEGGHVVVAGFGDGARWLVPVLRDAGVTQVVLTLSPDGAMEAEALGVRVIRGDYTRAHTLELAEAETARLLVVADDDPETTERVVAAARLANPDLRLLARVNGAGEAERLRQAGADQVVVAEVESAARLAEHILGAAARPPQVVAPGAAAVRLAEEQRRSADCTHAAGTGEVSPTSQGCEECLREGTEWVHLRLCMTCGHVGCCDSSPGQHARGHYEATEHPVIRSWEPGERWAWCFVDRTLI